MAVFNACSDACHDLPATQIEPAEGSLAPGASLDVELECTFNDLGSFNGDIILKEVNSSDERTTKVRLGCTVIQQTFEVRGARLAGMPRGGQRLGRQRQRSRPTDGRRTGSFSSRLIADWWSLDGAGLGGWRRAPQAAQL